MNNRIIILGMLSSLVLVISCASLSNPHEKVEQLANLTCYATFEEFAYAGPEISIPESKKMLPTEPWLIASHFPNGMSGDFNREELNWQVSLTRQINNQLEVWLTRRGGSPPDDIPRIVIYHAELEEWEAVSRVVEGSDIFVEDLFLTDDGTVWGKNSWDPSQANTSDQGPILSRYNEQTKQFEFVTKSSQMSFQNGVNYQRVFPLLDKENTFWIALNTDALYSYETDSERLIHHIDLQNISMVSLSEANDGMIYFLNPEETRLQKESPTKFMDIGFLMKFSPETKELTKIELPDIALPAIGPLRITKSNHLWLGAIGYLDLNDNNWHILQTNLANYINQYSFWLGYPDVLFEDTSGILWFGLNSELKEGMAWYDLESGQGCMFTNIYANIVEDPQQTLWMFMDGSLYKFDRE